MKTMEGGCHCGRVRFRVTADLDASPIAIARSAARRASAPDRAAGAVRTAQRRRTISRPTRSTPASAKHTFCKVCGIHPFYVPRSDPDKIDVNVRCLDDFDTSRSRRSGSTAATGRRRCKGTCRGDERASARRRNPRRPAHQPVRVYYEDTDFSGIVYHASYLRFMERGRTNYLRLLGADQRALFEEAAKEAPGFAFVVRSMQIDFCKPARMDDVLEIVTVPEEVKGASIVLHQQVIARRRAAGRGDTCGSLSSRAAGRGQFRSRCGCHEGRSPKRRRIGAG